MLPGQFDKHEERFIQIKLAVSALFLIFSMLFLVASLMSAWSALPNFEKQTTLEAFFYLSSTIKHLSNECAVYIGATSTAIVLVYSSYKQVTAHKREIELRKAFGQGLWGGYANNFFGEAVRKIKDDKDSPKDPIILFLSPTFGLLDEGGGREFHKLLTDLPVHLRRENINVDLVSNDIGYRRSQQFDALVGGKKERLIIDYPTTFASFHYGLEKIMKTREKYLSEEEKSAYFDEFKGDFFDEMISWSKNTYSFRYYIVEVSKLDAPEASKRISQALKAPPNSTPI